MNNLATQTIIKLIVLFLFTSVLPVFAQITNELKIVKVDWSPNVVQSFGSNEGLTFEHVNDFAFDENDMVWISTNSGIWLSDGSGIFQFVDDIVDAQGDYSKFSLVSETLWTADNYALYSINTITLKTEKYPLPEYILKVRPQSVKQFKDYLVINTTSGPLIFSLIELKYVKVLEVPEFSSDLSSTAAFDSVVIGDKLYTGFGSYFNKKNRVQGGMAVYDSTLKLIQYDDVISLFAPWTLEIINGTIYAATSNSGLITINTENLDVIQHISKPVLPGDSVLSVSKNKNGLWLSLLQGGVLREKHNEVILFSKQNGNITSNMTSVAKSDRNGHLWVGYFDKRIDVINTNNFDSMVFHKFKNTEYNISSAHVSDNNVIIGTSGAGLFEGDKQTSLSQISDHIIDDVIASIDSFESNVVIGTLGGGVWIKQKRSEQYSRLIDEKPYNRLVVQSLVALESTILLATAFGFYEFDYSGKPIGQQESPYSVNNLRITHFDRKIAFLLVGMKIGRFETSLSEVEWQEISSLDVSEITDLTAKTDTSVYLTSGGTLLLYDFQTQKLKTEFQSTSEITNVIYAEGQVFLTTQNNLYILSGESTFKYTALDGFKGTQISHKALQLVNGVLYVTSEQGVQEIEYANLIDTLEPSKAFVSNVSLNGKTNTEGFLNNVNLKLETDIFFANLKIVVPSSYPENISLDYSIPSVLEGWLPLDDSNLLQLPLNRYGNNSVLLRDRESKTPLRLNINYHVEKPWWMKTTSISAFVLSALCFMLLSFYFRERLNKKRTAALEEKVRERTKELNSVLVQKNTLFENISHEFRTPLTVILSNINSTVSEPNIIQSQCDRLLSLVNNLLALAEARSPKQKMSQVDLESKATVLVNSLESLAKERELQIYSTLKLTEKRANVYEGLLDLLINNVLGNAIKYATFGSKIGFEITSGVTSLELKVENESDIEANESLINRYEKSNQVHQSSGLGLDIVRELVERMNGDLQLSGNNGNFIVTVRIPITYVTEDSLTTIDSSTRDQQISDNDNDIDYKPLVLIVEDNEELRDHLNSTFKLAFEIVTAKDGKEALDWLHDITSIPDLIISDVMMPNMDGFELCENVKKDGELNGVPFILLTAKTDLSSQSKGYDLLADDYIGKPFNSNILISKAANLIRTFRKAKALAEKALLGMPNDIQDEFVSELRVFLEINFADVNLNLSSLAQHIHVSERTLERKLSAKLGSPFSTVLRKFRINKACEMLIKGKTIKETAFDSGFGSQSYFGQCFKQEKGVTPSTFVKKYNDSDAQSGQL